MSWLINWALGGAASSSSPSNEPDGPTAGSAAGRTISHEKITTQNYRQVIDQAKKGLKPEDMQIIGGIYEEAIEVLLSVGDKFGAIKLYQEAEVIHAFDDDTMDKVEQLIASKKESAGAAPRTMPSVGVLDPYVQAKMEREGAKGNILLEAMQDIEKRGSDNTIKSAEILADEILTCLKTDRVPRAKGLYGEIGAGRERSQPGYRGRKCALRPCRAL